MIDECTVEEPVLHYFLYTFQMALLDTYRPPSTLIDPHQPVIISYQPSMAVSNRIEIRFKSLTQTFPTPIDPCRPASTCIDPDVNLSNPLHESNAVYEKGRSMRFYAAG